MSGDNYGSNRITETVAYFSEDIKKMKSMTEEEASWIRARLFFEHK